MATRTAATVERDARSTHSAACSCVAAGARRVAAAARLRRGCGTRRGTASASPTSCSPATCSSPARAMAVARQRARGAARSAGSVLLVALGLVFNASTTTTPLRVHRRAADDRRVAASWPACVDRFARRADDVALGRRRAARRPRRARRPRVGTSTAGCSPTRASTATAPPATIPRACSPCVLGATALVLLGFVAARLRSWRFADRLVAVTAAVVDRRGSRTSGRGRRRSRC